MQARLDQLAALVRDVQSGKTKLISELTAAQVLSVMRLTTDKQSAKIQDAEARKLSKLRDSRGRMRRDDAIDLVANMHGVKPQTLADHMAGKRGASRGGWRRWPSKRKPKQAKK
jgi:hypothetical protein